MSNLLPTGTAGETDATDDVDRGQAGRGAGSGGSSLRRRAALVAAGLGGLLLYRRLRGRSSKESEAVADTRTESFGASETPSAERTEQRSKSKGRLRKRASRVAVGFVAAAAARRLLRRWQR